jgi:membrane fusion protein (multidrug efflux system)
LTLPNQNPTIGQRAPLSYEVIMQIFALILAVTAATFLLAPASAQDGENRSIKHVTQQSADKIKELQKERIATLEAMADIETRLHQVNKASMESMLEARISVCEAKLSAAENESDRITILKDLVELFKKHEELAKARGQFAKGTEASVLKVHAMRLEAEIRLEQARAGRQDQAKNTKQEPGKVVIGRPQIKDVIITRQFVCQIHSQRHIDIRPQQTGYLEEIAIKEGQAVKQGDVLFKVSPLIYQRKVDTELAEVEVAALNLKNAERLFQNKVVSEDEVALLKAKLKSAAAKAKLAQAELYLTAVRAPFDGIIDRLQEQQGSLVTKRDVLTTLSDNSVMWVYFNVPERCYLEYMDNPPKDQAAEVELVLTNGEKFPQPGKIATIEGQFDKEMGSILFRADFPNRDGRLRHGMTGNVAIHQTLSHATVIPQQATFEVADKRYVFVVDNDGAVHKREIVVQNELPDEFAIKKGLEVNDRILLKGVSQISDGENLGHDFEQP